MAPSAVAAARPLAAPRPARRARRPPPPRRASPRAASSSPRDADADADADADESSADAAAPPALFPSSPRSGGGISARWRFDTRYGHKAAALELVAEWVRTVGVAAGVHPTRVALYTGVVGCPESRVEMVLSQFANQGELDAFFARVPADAHRAWGERFAPHVVDGSPAWHVYRPVPVLRAPAAAEEASAAFSVGGGGLGGGGAAADSANAASSVASEAARPKRAPRPGRRPTPEEVRRTPVFTADDFGAGEPGGLVFPAAADLDGILAEAKKAAEAAAEAEAKKAAEAARAVAAAALAAEAADGAGEEEGEAAAAANGADAIDLSEYAPGSRVVMDWKGDPMVISPGDKLPNVA